MDRLPDYFKKEKLAAPQRHLHGEGLGPGPGLQLVASATGSIAIRNHQGRRDTPPRLFSSRACIRMPEACLQTDAQRNWPNAAHALTRSGDAVSRLSAACWAEASCSSGAGRAAVEEFSARECGRSPRPTCRTGSRPFFWTAEPLDDLGAGRGRRTARRPGAFGRHARAGRAPCCGGAAAYAAMRRQISHEPAAGERRAGGPVTRHAQALQPDRPRTRSGLSGAAGS
ncbi:MAG: hypothetical protein MZV70_68565 [Desulfobacterales bacterium]|nr:hypothetical protein [Desulfobacterales bacterium]